MTPPATHREVAELLGNVDELAVQRIVDTGATIDEIGEALDALDDGRGFGDDARAASSARVADVHAILTELRAYETYDDDEPIDMTSHGRSTPG